MNCAICNRKSEIIFSKRILNQYAADYHECIGCGFVFVPFHEQWLDEAYSSAITRTDIGLLSRNYNYAATTQKLLLDHFNTESPFLDYAGGYGVFTRLMRDRGFDFYHEDAYCENLFAHDFDVKRNQKETYELVTAFEFMEHIPDPVKELESIFRRTESFLFSTEIIPDNGLQNWWYLATETGQHISFYTVESLQVLAEKFNRRLHSNGKNLHLITSKELPEDILTSQRKSLFSFLKRGKKRKSRLFADYKLVKGKISHDEK